MSGFELVIVFEVAAGLWLAYDLGLRAVRVFEKWVDHYGTRKETIWLPGQAPSPASPVSPPVATPSRVPDSRVPEVSPEHILRRAPKSAGFGGPSHGSKPPEPGSGGEEVGTPAPPPDCPPGKV